MRYSTAIILGVAVMLLAISHVARDSVPLKIIITWETTDAP